MQIDYRLVSLWQSRWKSKPGTAASSATSCRHPKMQPRGCPRHRMECKSGWVTDQVMSFSSSTHVLPLSPTLYPLHFERHRSRQIITVVIAGHLSLSEGDAINGLLICKGIGEAHVEDLALRGASMILPELEQRVGKKERNCAVAPAPKGVLLAATPLPWVHAGIPALG